VDIDHGRRWLEWTPEPAGLFLRKIGSSLQELPAETAITDDSRLRELLYLEKQVRGRKS
jgi:hypothetical protein